MKLLFKLLPFLLFPIGAFTQSESYQVELTQHEADSLKLILQTTNNDTLKMVICKNLTHYSQNNKPDSIAFYNDEWLKWAQKLKQKIWEGQALGSKVYNNISGGKPTEALNALNEARKIAENEANEQHMYIEPQRVRFSTPHTARLALLASVEMHNSFSHVKSENYDKSIEDIFKAIKIAEGINDEVGLCQYYRGLYVPYQALQKMDSAIWAQEKAIYYAKKTNSKRVLAQSYRLLGFVYSGRKGFVTAKKYLLESLNVSIEINEAGQLAASYIGLSYLHRDAHQPDSNIFYLRKSLLAYQNFMGDGPEVYDDIYLGISRAYKEKGNIDSAYFYLDRSTTIVNRRFDKQIEDYKKYKDFYVEEQQKVKEAEKKTIQQQNYGLLAGLGLLSLIGLMLYRNNGQKQKANAVLENTLSELKETQTQLIEKEQIASAAAVRLQELDTLKTRLYTNITHEFRTPLTVILGMAQQIKDKPAEFMQEGLGMIKRNGQNLLNLVNQLLDLSKLENGKLALHYQHSEVVNFMKYLVESFHSYAQSKEVKIHFISDLEELTMDFDETYLQQIVSNLLTNAVKFTPKRGDIYVSLSIQRTTFSFKVRDTGMGISEANLPFIFDRFYQVDDSTTRHGEGTGIGLSLTRELVKLMEGSISVKSQVNKGTEFEVVLPIRHIAEINAEYEHLPVINRVEVGSMSLEELLLPIDSELSPLDQEISTEKPLILIADDNADVRTYIASCLGTDYNLIVAKDGQECETLAYEQTPDLIISDVMMPVKDGFEVCKTLKSDERTSHIPIIMLTAKADIESKLQGLERGADAYLMKPFHKQELLLRIKKLLELRQQLQLFYRATMDLKGILTEGGNIQAVEVAIEKFNPLVNNADHAFVLKVRTLIEANLNNASFDVEKLCRNLLLSPSQVYRKLTALTGLSTNNFIRYVRLVKAKEMLLKNVHFSVAAVAYDSGFNDPAYFSRVFKQEFGVTPQTWREQNQAQI